ncbi:hypothetical protein Drorol1_Dr00012913 [Drosera rotundifolia]
MMENPTAPPHPPPIDHRQVHLNVGGSRFETTTTTLSSTTLLLSDTSSPHSIFIDRDPDSFSSLLSLLRRHHHNHHHDHCNLRPLLSDSAFYGADSLLRAALSPPPFSGLDASLASTVVPSSHPFVSAFDATGDRVSRVSILIAHGGLVSVYDDVLFHLNTFRTHLDLITSIRTISGGMVAVGSEAAAGMHFYGVVSGCHVGSVHWTDKTDPRIYKSKVSAIEEGEDCVYAAFDCRHGENAVLVVDKETMRVRGEIGRQTGHAAKKVAPGKLDWVPELGVLVGSRVTSGAFGFAGYVRVWDVRSGNVVWETSEPGSGMSSGRFGDAMCDVDVDAEDGVVVKVCSKSGDVGLADMRMFGDDPWVYLEDPDKGLKAGGVSGGDGVVCCWKKQVFVGREKGLEVWSRGNGVGGYRRNYVDRVEDAERGLITKIEGSGGGNRLFVARENVEGIEIWESSRVSGAVSAL